MVSVGVIGGGMAGVAAAEEASKRGATVTLFEAGEELSGGKRSWTSLLSGGPSRPTEPSSERLNRLGVKVKLQTSVKAIQGDGTVRFHQGANAFDSLILATGTRLVAERLGGGVRPGVHILSGRASYLELADAMRGYSEVAVVGSGRTLLDVANRLAAAGIGARIFSPGGEVWPKLGDPIRARLEEALAASGVPIMPREPDRLAGVEKVEAVVAGGDVYPCQAVVLVPRTLPEPLGTPVQLGRLGGVAVNSEMKSSLNRLFAAGGCAELKQGSSTIHYDSESSASVMGMVAGANASGGRVSAHVAGCVRLDLFGVGLVVAGMSLREAESVGLSAKQTTSDEAGFRCALVFDSGSLRLLGVQLIGQDAGAYEQDAGVVVSESLGVDDVAYQESSSTGPSPIQRTAREAMRGRK